MRLQLVDKEYTYMDNMIYFDHCIHQINFANFHWKHNKNGYKIVPDEI